MTAGLRKGRLVRRSRPEIRNACAVAAVVLLTGCAAAGSIQSSSPGRPHRQPAPAGATARDGATALGATASGGATANGGAVAGSGAVASGGAVASSGAHVLSGP